MTDPFSRGGRGGRGGRGSHSGPGRGGQSHRGGVGQEDEGRGRRGAGRGGAQGAGRGGGQGSGAQLEGRLPYGPLPYMQPRPDDGSRQPRSQGQGYQDQSQGYQGQGQGHRPRPSIGDRTSSLQRSEPPKTSLKRPRDAIVDTLETAKRRKLAAKASRDSLHQLEDLGWWTYDKTMHQASSEELRAQTELEKMTPSEKSKKEIQDLVSQLEASLDLEIEAENHSRRQELKKEVALLEAAKNAKEMIRPETLNQGTNAFLSIATEILFAPGGTKRTRERQLAWKTALIVRYNAMAKHKPSYLIGKSINKKYDLCTKKVHLWCPVLQTYKLGQYRTAAHIVPHRLGQTGFELFFGKDIEGPNKSTWSLRNGLILSSAIEVLFDEGAIVITPRSSAPGDDEFETRVLDRSLKDEELQENSPGCEYTRDLHGRKLVFKNNERPGRRFLYLMYCAALYKASRQGKANVVQEELTGGKQIWATPGPYIRDNMLRALTANMGHDTSMLHSERHTTKSKINSNEAAAAEASGYNEVAIYWKHDIDLEEEKDREIPEGDETDVLEFLRDDQDWLKYD